MARATRSLPVPLSPVISTVRLCPCRRWIWSATRFIAALAQMNPGSSGSSGRSLRLLDGLRRPLARAAQLEALARDGREHAEPAHRRHRSAASARRSTHDARTVVIACRAASVSSRPSPYSRRALRGGAGERARDVGVAPGAGERRAASPPAARRRPRRHRPPCVFEQRGRGLAREQLGKDRRIHQPPDDAPRRRRRRTPAAAVAGVCVEDAARAGRLRRGRARRRAS